MARPKKTGLDYFPFDVNFFSDKKIKRLRAKYGNDGIVVYIYVLCLIYGDKGYYTEYDEDFILDVSDELNISESSTRQIMKYLLSRSLLSEIHDSTLAKPVTIISARSIQRRFQEAKKSGKGNVFVRAGYWLLEKAETLGFIKVQPYDNFSEKNNSYSEKNEDKSQKNDTKESKVNKSKVNKSKVNKSKVCMFEIPYRNGNFIVDEEYYTELAHTYPNMNIAECFRKMVNYLSVNPERQKYINSAKSYISTWLDDDEKAGKYRKKAQYANYDIKAYEETNVIFEEGFV